MNDLLSNELIKKYNAKIRKTDTCWLWIGGKSKGSWSISCGGKNEFLGGLGISRLGRVFASA